MRTRQPESVLIAGDAYPRLGQEIAAALELKQIPVSISSFADGETHISLGASVRGKQVLIVQPTSPPSNERLMTLALLADAARGAGAAKVIAVVPYSAMRARTFAATGRFPRHSLPVFSRPPAWTAL